MVFGSFGSLLILLGTFWYFLVFVGICWFVWVPLNTFGHFWYFWVFLVGYNGGKSTVHVACAQDGRGSTRLQPNGAGMLRSILLGHH